MKRTWRVRVSPTLSIVLGPCTHADMAATLDAWGYVTTVGGSRWFTVDVSQVR